LFAMTGAANKDFAEADAQLMQNEEEVVENRSPSGAARKGLRGAMAVTLALALVVATAFWAHSRPVSAAPGSVIGFAASKIAADAEAEADDAAEAEESEGKDDEEGDDKEKPKEKPACKMEHAGDEPSLFCWAVMFDDDKALIKSQMAGRVGIFACNDFMVIGKEEFSYGTDDCGVVRKSMAKDLPDVKKGMYGVDGSMTSSWLNVPIFLVCWDAVIESNKVWENDFTVKVDPDTVFFPGRLGYHMKEYKDKAIYTTDCRYWDGDKDGKVFGSIEVLSKGAIGAYKGNAQKCKDLPWQGWGEDYWLQHCMRDAIGLESVIIADWTGDTTCPLAGIVDCGDKNFISNHPHKDAGDWWSCWKQSNGE